MKTVLLTIFILASASLHSQIDSSVTDLVLRMNAYLARTNYKIRAQNFSDAYLFEHPRSSLAIRTVKAGEMVTVLASEDYFYYRVKTGNNEGYLRADNLRFYDAEMIKMDRDLALLIKAAGYDPPTNEPTPPKPERSSPSDDATVFLYIAGTFNGTFSGGFGYGKNSRHRFFLGGSYQFNGQKSIKPERKANYGRTVINNGYFIWLVDAGYSFMLWDFLTLSGEVSAGSKNGYTNYKDDRFRGGGYALVNETKFIAGVGGYIGFNFAHKYEPFLGYHTLKSYTIGMRFNF